MATKTKYALVMAPQEILLKDFAILPSGRWVTGHMWVPESAVFAHQVWLPESGIKGVIEVPEPNLRTVQDNLRQGGMDGQT